MYDYLIVGAGLFGSVFAHEAFIRGKKCLVVDKRKHTGGNIYCEKINDINVHRYGPHIFHTNDLEIWNYVNSFVRFNNFINSPLALVNGKLYNLPFNMNTFYQLWGISSPLGAQLKIEEQSAHILNPSNLEEQAIKLVGTDLYELFIKGYTEKQWGRKCKDLPSFIIKRIPVRFTFDNNYFYDRYQGIPEGGYNCLIDGLLKGIEVKLNVDFFKERDSLSSLAKTVVYTGPIDQYFDYCFGELEYRSLRFEDKIFEIDSFQGNAIVNYPDRSIPWTRVIEHKHFEKSSVPGTVVTYEYPQQWSKGLEPYYPVNDEKNNKKFRQYRDLAELQKNLVTGGRLGSFKYFDMHQVVGSALATVRKVMA